MTVMKLTPGSHTATVNMTRFLQGSGKTAGQSMKWVPFLIVMSSGLQGCVNVTAPDKPIVINLNINIKQEVVYRLADDAKALIDENPEIF